MNKHIFKLSIFLCIMFLSAVASNNADSKENKKKLWVAISIPKPIYVSGQTDKLSIAFAMVNDGEETIFPDYESWRLNINGEDHPKSQYLFCNGPKNSNWDRLPASKYLFFGYGLSKWFDKPGIYTMFWHGKGFKTDPITFRVMPPNEFGF